MVGKREECCFLWFVDKDRRAVFVGSRLEMKEVELLGDPEGEKRDRQVLAEAKGRVNFGFPQDRFCGLFRYSLLARVAVADRFCTTQKTP